MTIKPRSLLCAIAIAGCMAPPLAAQSNRTSPDASRPAPAPAPRSTAPAPPTTAPASASPATAPGSTTPAPSPVGTSGAATATSASVPATAGTRAWNERDYRLGAGDKLRVEVYGEPQLSQALQVRPDGKITLPLIGDVAAAGRTSLELRDALTTSLKQYVNSPAVTVIVQEAVANRIDVVGEVSSPGQQVLFGPLTILQAVSHAGGPKEFAKTGSIYVLRPNGSGTPQRIDAQYKDALRGKVAPLVLQPGDTVVVP